MNTDALTAIEHFANGIFSAGMDFLFTWGEFLGVIGLIAHLASSRVDGPTRMTPGKFVGGLFTCAMLVSLPSIINAGGIQMGFHADSFGPIAYVQPQSFGAAAGAANAVLSLAKLAGVGFVMSGISIWRKAGLDGHTSLSASETISKGNVKFIAGVLLVFIDRVLDALLASIGLAF
ncbi:conjugal transfer protein TraQ [Salmonella enterica]|uniref:conjugal transfer protein TraQ n=1 Tax=Salmonella enterica TaxID=28901 RepID=UPI001C45A0D9|nr:conjugal transfer protein TraQ [Salmonella enterica]